MTHNAYARRIDSNLEAIASAFEDHGFLVHRTNGAWDLTVQYRGITLLVEVKRPKLPPSKRHTKQQLKLQEQGWRIRRVETPEDVVRARQELYGSGTGEEGAVLADTGRGRRGAGVSV